MSYRFVLFAILGYASLLAPTLHAQLQIKGGATNLLDGRRAGAYATVSTAGVVTAITVRGGGSGYTSPPLVTIGPGTTTATATAVLTGGVVTSITLTNGGSGYFAAAIPPAAAVASAPTVTIAGPAAASGSGTTTPQFAGLGATSATSGAVKPTSLTSTIAGITAGRYPTANDKTNPLAPVPTAVLARSSAGYSLASGVPRCSFGDTVDPPALTWSGAVAPANYWRQEPVKAGEVFTNAYLGNLSGATQPLVASGSVTVTNCSPSSNIVTVASLPSGLVSGATLLGKRVDLVNGLTLTLRGNPSETISTGTVRTFLPTLSYYYSPHAGKVFASQPGQVTVTWVSSLPDTSAPSESVATYKFKTEVFSVGSTPQVPERMIYWTEKSFTGPKVTIPSGRIVAANVIYNRFMPSHVVDEFVPPGYNPSNQANNTLPSEQRTLWYENTFGVSALHAYNTEGSALVEYLGRELDGTGKREFLGADVVTVERDADPVYVETKLGEQLVPWQSSPQPGDAELTPSMVFDIGQIGGKALYGTSTLANGQSVYHAERENDNPDKISIYWMMRGDASIYQGAVPNLQIPWPKVLCKYTQIWSASISDYEAVAVTAVGSGIATGPQFEAARLPQLIYQDDPRETEVSVDLTTQRLMADFSASADKTSRSLLKFMDGGTPWYVPLYIQSEDKLGQSAAADPDGSGPQVATAAVSTINDLDANGVADLVATVQVGDRIEPPSGYSRAGYIASGDNYYPAGYIDPMARGAAAAEAGAIIPVNSRVDHDRLTIWWFKKVVPANPQFTPFYLPSKVGRYTVAYPVNQPQIVIASGLGTGELGPAQQAGSVYYQNDPNKPGFNPNEEHALIFGGRAYAMRSDLNTAASSPGFVLISYTDPADLRPSMDIYQVVRETLAYPLRYDAIAGTKVTLPRPLSYLPLALNGDGVSINYEVPGLADPPASASALAAYKHDVGYSASGAYDYSSFTFKDRQGYDWTYRGSHDKASAQATAAVNSSGAVSGITVINKGAGYAVPPTVTVSSPPAGSGGTTATASAVLGGLSSASFSIASGTQTYTVAPTVTISGGGGSTGALAQALLNSQGLVIGITLTTSGSGYTSAPVVSFSGGTVSVAGTAPTGTGNASNFCVTAISLTSGGSGYDANPPTVSIAPPVSFGMKFYYYSLAGFYDPRIPSDNQPAPGTIMPFVEDVGDGVPITLSYTPKWPDDPSLPVAQQKVVPTLKTGQTLTLADDGLPQIRGASSVEVLYQQSVAKSGVAAESVALHDPTRAKSYALSDTGLSQIPPSVLTSDYAGRTYFQKLPPHLQQRFYYDRNVGAAGALLLKGEFIDVVVGVDYLNLNVLGADDLAALKGLCPSSDTTYKGPWDAAIDGLSTTLETSIENTAKPGTFKVDSSQNVVVDKSTLSNIVSPDTAVDSYALSSTGLGNGYVVLMGENGNAFTDSGNTVAMQIIKVSPSLYVGDIKVLLASNPLDEQVTLRHSGDYSGHPELYEFQWRYGFPARGTQPDFQGVTAEANAEVGGGGVTKVVLSTAGSAYAAAPAITVAAPPTSVRATATATYTGTNNFTIAINNPGTNYASAPSVSFLGGGGTGASWTTTLGLTAQSFVITSGDKVYTTAPTVAISGGLGSGATATAVLSNGTSGTVTGISIVAMGMGYITAPTLTFSGGVSSSGTIAPTALGNATQFTVSTIQRVLTGTGYNSAPTVTIGVPATAVTATATATLSNGALSGITVVSPGKGYIAAPVVTIAAPAAAIDLVSSGTAWFKPNGTLGSSILVGGSPSAVLSDPAVLMGDSYFTMNYRLKVNGQAASAGWSGWCPPVLVEGWIKRVLAKLTPFNQRMSDLYNNEVNTDVSMLTQAGTRWEGDIALNLDNINEAGLIQIYETVLNRGKLFTIGSGVDFQSSNNALILAAGYLNDLYTILGNEAYADAANPTISIDDQTTVTEVNTSRFSFEGQVKSSLEEELGLLKGRDDSVNPGVGLAPAYNRLWWNYTRGINSGEVLYATNYNIVEKTGSNTANGVVDAADAQRMFPQGHGDAYGHYLTALKGYYKLLEHPYFSWVTSSEDVTVLGQSVQIDYKDERKFAAAAANLASTARQIVALVHRQNYQDDPASGWSQFRDGKLNSRTGVVRYQALDEWVSRSAQASYANWISANTLLPDKDNDPNHTGVQIIDRTTVPELNQLSAAGDDFQSTIDSANAHLNPLGLSPGAIAFDISPSQLQAGKSHFEQINERALRATLNAKGAFNQAAKMSRLLRNQENQIGDSNTAIVDQEGAFVSQLIELYGTPYSGEIGVGKDYPQDYAGPDISHWYVVDRPTDLVDTTQPVTITLKVPTVIKDFIGISIYQMATGGDEPTNTVTKTLTVTPNKHLIWGSEWGGSSLGQRATVGRAQQALLDCYQAQMAVLESNHRLQVLNTRFKREFSLYNELVANIIVKNGFVISNDIFQFGLNAAKGALEDAALMSDAAAAGALGFAEAAQEFIPEVVGLANSVGSPAKGAVKVAGATAAVAAYTAAATGRVAANALADTMGIFNTITDRAVMNIDFNYEAKQQLYEFEQLYRELLSVHFEMTQLMTDYQRCNEALRNVLVEGENILADRESYRQRAAAVITGYRTKDLTFRTFRNEALEQYRTLYDLAGRYTYLAAKSYDYETGLLGSTAGKALIARVVASRALGDLEGDQPQATVSTLGDSGLAGTLAQLNADFAVAKGRLGINNPDPYGTLFSLRQELFRIQDDPAKTSDDVAWKQTLQQYIVPNLMTDADVARYCNNLKKADGSAAPGMVISFGSTIDQVKNFFGLPGAAGDHAYSPSSYATKISSVGIVLKGYIGMDPYAIGTPSATGPASASPYALKATPYVYLIPCGSDCMLAPPLGDTNTLRSWTVHDQALPLPFNLGASAFNRTQFFDANGSLSEQPWILRKHQAFRPVSDPAFFYGNIPAEFTNARLVGRSVWNTRWKIVIPAYTLLADEQAGLTRFVESVSDIQLFLRTYSNAGN